MVVRSRAATSSRMRSTGPTLADHRCAHATRRPACSAGRDADEHRDGHGSPPSACDGCGGGGWLRPLVQLVAARRFIVRGLDSRTRVASGPLLVEGLAVCSGCAGGTVP